MTCFWYGHHHLRSRYNLTAFLVSCLPQSVPDGVILSPKWCVFLSGTSSCPADHFPPTVPAFCTYTGWPKHSKGFEAALNRMKEGYVLRPLPAHRRDMAMIPPHLYEQELRGATAIFELRFKRYTYQLRKDKVQDHFIAEIVKIRVLVPPTEAHTPMNLDGPGRWPTNDTPLPDLGDFRGAIECCST